MNILSKNAKNFLRKFIAWGGLAATTVYFLDGHLDKAAVIALIIGAAAGVDEYYGD